MGMASIVPYGAILVWQLLCGAAALNITTHLRADCPASTGLQGQLAFVCNPETRQDDWVCKPFNVYANGPDCQYDCPNGRDEECIDGMEKCDKCKCVAPKAASTVCFDKIEKCPYCGMKTYTCDNGDTCIPEIWVSDDYYDCVDKTDEEQCRFNFTNTCPKKSKCIELTLPLTYKCECVAGYEPTYDAKRQLTDCSKRTTTSTTTTTTPTTTTTTTTPTTTTTTPTTTTTTPTTTTTSTTTTPTTTSTTTTPTTTTTTTPVTTTTALKCPQGKVPVNQGGQMVCDLICDIGYMPYTHADGTEQCVPKIEVAIAACGSKPGSLGIQCANGTCVSLSRMRDCVKDCADGIDEQCWPGYVQCDDCKCVRPERVKADCGCPVGSGVGAKLCDMDQPPYSYVIYRCGDGTCLLSEWLEDGEPDCADDEDEKCLLQPCGPNAECVRTSAPIGQGNRLYECQCEPGYSDVSGQCVTTTTSTTSTSTSTTTTTPTTTSTTTPTTTTPTTSTSTTTPTTTSTSTTTTPTTTTTTTTPTTSTTTTTPTTTSTSTTTTPTTTSTSTSTTTTTPTTTSTTTTPTTSTTTSTPTTTSTSTTTTPTTTTTTTTPTSTSTSSSTSTPTTSSTTTTPTTSSTSTSTTTPTTTSTSTTTPTTTSTSTTTPTTSTSTTTTTTSTTTSTTSSTSTTTPTTTERPAPIQDMRTTFGAMLDGTSAVQAYRAFIRLYTKNIVNGIEQRWPGRFYNYLVGGFDASGTSVTKEDRYLSLGEFVDAVDLWDPPAAQGFAADSRAYVGNLAQALAESLRACTLVVFSSGPNTDADDQAAWQQYLSRLVERQCQVYIIQLPNPLDTWNDPKQGISPALLSAGMPLLVELGAVASQMAQIERLIVEMGSNTRYLMDAGNYMQRSGATYRRVAMDPETKNMTIVVSQSCATGSAPKVSVRDDQGTWYTAANTSKVITTATTDAFVAITVLNPAGDCGHWLVKMEPDAKCAIWHYRITGSGGSDYIHKYTWNTLDEYTYNYRPALGVDSFSVSSLVYTFTTPYFVDTYQQVLDGGSASAVSRAVPEFGDTFVSRHTMMAPGAKSNFWTKSTGTYAGCPFQRFSWVQTSARPLDIVTNLKPDTAVCAKHEFYCGASPDPAVVESCIDLAQYRTGAPQCFSGMDEACEIDEHKCCGVCTPVAQPCSPPELIKLCTELPADDRFECYSGGACVPKAWIDDLETDCPDNSDDDPSYIDECSLGLSTCHTSATCTNIVDSGYYCTCQSGDVGDGFTCANGKGGRRSTSTTGAYASSSPTLPPVTLDRVLRSIYHNGTHGCKVGQIDCLDETKCVGYSKRMDGVEDCKGGVDEECLPGTVYCDNGRCVHHSVARQQCYDMRLEALCVSSEPAVFQCKATGDCIYYQWAMDSVKDCADGSDEDARLWDECLLGRHSCSEDAVCTDITPPDLSSDPAGRHSCLCKAGYVGDGLTCVKRTNPALVILSTTVAGP